MKNLIVSLAATILGFVLFAPYLLAINANIGTGGSIELCKPSRKHLKPFSSEADLQLFLKKIIKKRGGVGYGSGSGDGAGKAAPAPAVATVTVTAGGDLPESITNTQHANVDEGGIVKMHGDLLVVLRRGRLFTVSIGGNSLKPVSAINAFGPDMDPSDTWYDEMLISGDNIVVIGYSYDRGGTELGLFKIDRNGGLSYRSTYHLRSNDYYSSRNYASRLIGDKLIFYAPLFLGWEESDLIKSFPALRRWHKNAKDSEFKRIVTATRVYRPERPFALAEEIALHTVTTCDLASSTMKCEATSVFGPPESVFYVSQSSVYVWATTLDYENEKERNRSTLFRMPLDGSHPSALGVSGGPVDQFSFLEDETGGLNVLVRSDSNGDGMWNAEVTEGDIALLHVEPGMLADGSTFATASSYRALEKVPGHTFQNRFIGKYLLYGTGSNWGPPQTTDSAKLMVVNWKTGTLSKITLPHAVDRLDLLSGDGIVVGANGNDLYFSSISLGALPRLVDTYHLTGASQGETRSHGFFYKPEDSNSGVLGLPITRGGRPGYKQLLQGSALIIFLSNNKLRFSEIGTLQSGSTSTDDDCKASCVDWYGNARPIFVRGRVFALLGYEIVEGSSASGRIEEIRRADFSPK